MEILEYVFEKKDGDIRILQGTRNFYKFKRIFPNIWNKLKPIGERKSSEEVITLIDLELKEWRSIRPESIIAVRRIREFKPIFTFYDNDGYIRRAETHYGPNYIKRNKVPYHVLMIINSHEKGIERRDIEIKIDKIVSLQNRDLRVRGRGLRAIARAVRLFKNNSFIKLKNNKYYITDKGRRLLETGVLK